MTQPSYSQSPFLHSMTFGFISLLFSHLPIIIVFIIQWMQDRICPSFDLIFDSGRVVSIWIPILGMLIISLYEVSDYKKHSGLEVLLFAFIVILFFLLTALYTFFFYSQLEYANWMKWMAIAILIVLYLFLVFSKYLEYSAYGDLQEARAKDQDALDQKLSNLK